MLGSVRRPRSAPVLALVAFCLSLVAACASAPPSSGLHMDAALDLHNGARHGAYVFSGQPSPDDLERLAEQGVTRVVSLRAPEEDEGFDEPAVCQELGLHFVQLPFDPARSDEAAVDAILNEFRHGPADGTLVHCGTANRVAMVFAVHRVIDQGVDLEQAIRDAKAVGMKAGAAEDFVRGEVARRTSP